MYNINLVCTRHQESGNCNSQELLQIIEKIKPEIIFEELSYSNFDKCYKEESLVTLETSAIKQYLQNNQIKHIPVDTYALPESYHKDVDQMLDKLFKGIGQNSFHLRSLINRQNEYTSQLGFKYLNSDYHNNLIVEYYQLREAVLIELNNERLFSINNLDKEIIGKREFEILTNVYKYSSENPYKQALMFIGSGHRKSIFALIEKFKLQEELKLNWILW